MPCNVQKSTFTGSTYTEAIARLGAARSKKIANNTTLIRRRCAAGGPDRVAVCLHSTDVVTYYADGGFTVCPGVLSQTTARRIAQFTGNRVRLRTHLGRWIIAAGHTLALPSFCRVIRDPGTVWVFDADGVWMAPVGK